MSPRPQIHGRIQGQRLIFHFNSLATQSQPCERRQPALRVPNETIKRLNRSASIPFTTQRPLNSAWYPRHFGKGRVAGVQDRNLSTKRLATHGGPLLAEVCVSAGKQRLAHIYYMVGIRYRQLFLSAKIDVFVVPF